MVATEIVGIVRVIDTRMAVRLNFSEVHHTAAGADVVPAGQILSYIEFLKALRASHRHFLTAGCHVPHCWHLKAANGL